MECRRAVATCQRVWIGSLQIEDAVEVVVRWLDEHGRSDLAKAVKAAMDPQTHAERKVSAKVRSLWAAELGKRGGSSTSEAKAAAARANGIKGGPRK